MDRFVNFYEPGGDMRCHCCGAEYMTLQTDVYMCSECNHIYRDYKGDSIDYHTNCYRDEEGFRGSDEIVDGKITETFHNNRAAMCHNRVVYSNQFLGTQERILDIGAGAGTFAKTLKASFPLSEIKCAELDNRLVEECRNLGFESTQADILNLSDEDKFDSIFMWHVLEHIQDLQGSVKKLSKIMKLRAIIEVPLLVAMNGQGRRRELTPPNEGKYDGHYHYFCERSFKKLMKKCGMNIVDIREGVQSPALLAVIEHA